jgi:hypothetical protein
MRVGRSFRAVAAAGLGGVALFAASGMAPISAGGWTITPVVSGLNGPRGVAFDNAGSLYVAEAGAFTPIESGFGASHTGAVDKYSLSGTTATRLWQTHLDSVYDSEHGPEVLGPAGVSALGNGCMKNDNGQREGCQVMVIVDESKQGIDSVTSGLNIPQIGHLFRLDGLTGAATDKSDVGDQQYTWAAQHKNLWIEFPDSNPYGVLVTKDPTTDSIRTFVADAGANTVSEVMPDGTTRVIAYIPNDPIRDSTPTCIAQGPDGALYVGTLDLIFNFVTGGGKSHVYRIDPNTTESYLTAAHVWASGLTTVTACAFDRSGNFWATEMFEPEAGPPGDIVRIPFNNPSQLNHVGGGSLPLPGGIAQGPDGGIYVSINSADPTTGSGKVMRVSAA